MQRVFLTRTAVLDRMCGPLCQALLERPGSGADLAGLARSNLLAVPLDRRGQWYRYHHLFREMLLAELRRCANPARIRVAASSCWYLQPARGGAGVFHRRERRRYGRPSGGRTDGADLPGRPGNNPAAVVPLAGRPGWDHRTPVDRGVGRNPGRAHRAAGRGRPVGRRGGPLAAPDRGRAYTPVAAAWAAVLRALLCRHGVKQMSADADEAARRLTAAGIVAPVVPLVKGIAQVLDGDPDDGDASFENAISIGDVGAPDVLAMALCQGFYRWRWLTTTGARPGSGRGRQCRAAPGRDRRQLRHAPGLRRAGPRAHAPRRHRGCAAAAGRCPAAAARAELRTSAHCRAGADRTGPRTPRAGRHGRGQDADVRTTGAQAPTRLGEVRRSATLRHCGSG